MKYTGRVSKTLLASFLFVLLLSMNLIQAAAANGTGSITIQNAARGESYQVYKLFDATVDANDGAKISYKLPAGKQASDLANNTWFKVDAAGNVLLNDNITAEQLATDEFKQWATTFGTSVAGPTQATGAALVFDNLAYGYYYVTSSLGAVISVDSTTPAAVINDKNDQGPNIDPNDPTSGKNIVTGENTAARAYTARIGDKIPFRVKFTATNYVTANAQTKQITQYKIVDTPTNLEILNTNANPIKVKVGENFLEANKYTVSIAPDTGVMTVTIPWVGSNNASLYNSAETVELTYSAIVKRGAADALAKNEAAITYRTTDQQPTDPDTPVIPPERPDEPDTPEIKTYKITLNKVNGANQSPLTGAEFRLYDAETEGNEISLVKVQEGIYRVAERSENGAVSEDNAGVVVQAGTGIIIKGLKGQTNYYLEETKAPDGYNRLLTRTLVRTENEDATAAADATVTVANNAGTELPSTGGMGRTLIYIIGYSLVIGVGIALVAKRRMKSYRS